MAAAWTIQSRGNDAKRRNADGLGSTGWTVKGNCYVPVKLERIHVRSGQDLLYRNLAWRYLDVEGFNRLVAMRETGVVSFGMHYGDRVRCEAGGDAIAALQNGPLRPDWKWSETVVELRDGLLCLQRR